VSDLPSGTVTLLFSDIEGSTVLLSRLGAVYAEALDGQRQVLRKAWVDHGGIELGMEGDSFMVVFPTAEGAVSAAGQAQQELAVFEWPAGETVTVRMGIHTGTPQVHGDGYVGMDVHRAARIAGAAHGGQVVLSQATAGLVDGCLPDATALRDLGSHRLKDIAAPEHLFQLAIDGLPNEFPSLKTLGAASSLPRPATPLVGRDGELAELPALLGSADVRLVTLTGPGGSGKTRLAIAFAQKLIERFPDGVFFVPLAAVVTADLMWTSIAEVLDVPAEARTPPGFFEHVAHRSALFVLDNLEQISGADAVLAELLDHAPRVELIATSRKPLAVRAEHVYPVPMLELPAEVGLDQTMRSAAVQLFVHQARRVKPSFIVTADNAFDVAEICRRLDGLPLAMELAAARTRLLTPKALLARLDKALDISAPGNQALMRQKTLRDTIAWSYNLLTGEQRSFFRRLAVFAGGADLASIEQVTAALGQAADPLEAVADLADASLVTIGEDGLGEPRVNMLETVRQFAREQLEAVGELNSVRQAHASHYLVVARDLRERLPSGGPDQLLDVRRRFQLEHDNFREILAWALTTEDSDIGLCMYRVMVGLWMDGGYWSEWSLWQGRAIDVLGGDDSPELGRCLSDLALFLRIKGDLREAHVVTARSCAMWRRLGDKGSLAHALIMWADCERLLGDRRAARRACEEAEVLARSIHREWLLADALEGLAEVECDLHNFQESLDLNRTVMEIRRNRGDERGVLNTSHTISRTLKRMGRLRDAEREMREQIPRMVHLADPALLSELIDDYATLLAELDRPDSAARLLGAADAMRARNDFPRDPIHEVEIQEPMARAQTRNPVSWRREYESGRAMTVEDALTHAHASDVTD
jgi:predicted ATPase/class 3 adenylate cyclase